MIHITTVTHPERPTAARVDWQVLLKEAQLMNQNSLPICVLELAHAHLELMARVQQLEAAK